MGNILSCYRLKNEEEDEENLIILDIPKFVYTYNCCIIQSTSELIHINEEYDLYLCENDIIIKNTNKKFTFIYNNIPHWTFTEHFFGFTYRNLDKLEEIVIKVNNGYEIADNLKKHIYELVDYYKSI